MSLRDSILKGELWNDQQRLASTIAINPAPIRPHRVREPVHVNEADVLRASVEVGKKARCMADSLAAAVIVPAWDTPVATARPSPTI